MAYDISASAVNNTGANASAVSVSDPGFTAGDLIIAYYFCLVTNTSVTLSGVPTGFTQFGSATVAPNHGSQGTMLAYWSTTKSATYTFTPSSSGDYPAAVVVLGHSGRSLAAPTRYVGTPTNDNVASGPTPITVPLTSPVFDTNDDVHWVGLLNNQIGWTWTPPAGYTNRQAPVLNGNGEAGSMAVCTIDSVASAAAGTVIGSASTTSGNEDASGFMVALPAAATGPTARPVDSNGKLLISNGKIVTGALMFMPLSWTINRRMQREKERRAVRDILKRGH